MEPTPKPTPNQQHPKADVKPLLRNFGSQFHKFTPEDRVKGGSVMTPLKSKANAYRALKTGKYSRTLNLPRCNQCPFGGKNICMEYKPNEACRMQKEEIHKVFKLHGTKQVECFRELNEVLQKFKMKVLTNSTEKNLKDYFELLIKYTHLKYGEKINTQPLDIGNLMLSLREEGRKQTGVDPVENYS